MFQKHYFAKLLPPKFFTKRYLENQETQDTLTVNVIPFKLSLLHESHCSAKFDKKILNNYHNLYNGYKKFNK